MTNVAGICFILNKGAKLGNICQIRVKFDILYDKVC